MYINERKRNSKNYKYIEHSYRVNNKVKKISIYLSKNKKFTVEDFEKINTESINKISKEKVNEYKKTREINEFFLYGDIILKIEKIRSSFKLLFLQLDETDKEKLIKDYLRNFTVNSMEMEGGTVTYDIAKKIDMMNLEKIPKNVNKNDILLYNNIKQGYKFIESKRFRRALSFAKLHKMLYDKLFSFAGKFRNKNVTFGGIKSARTADFKDIVKNLNHLCNNYPKIKKKKYLFQAILENHTEYQQIHPFEDGNSRLGRLILTYELLKNGYPPPILKKENSFGYRSSLVKSINNNDKRAFFKLYYKMYKNTWIKFFKPLIEKKLSNNNKLKEFK